MNTRSLLIVVVVGLVLISCLDAAKPQKGGKGKGKNEKAKVEKAIEPLEEEVIVAEQVPPPIYRPKKLKIVTAYDKCKMDCQRARDNQDVHSYVAQLREELAAAEAILNAEADLSNHVDETVQERVVPSNSN